MHVGMNLDVKGETILSLWFVSEAPDNDLHSLPVCRRATVEQPKIDMHGHG